MNVERCIKLHNEILRHGWVHSGHNISQFETVARSWMSHFGDDEGILANLVPEIRQFLQQAQIILSEPDKAGGFSFFFWVNNLAAPGNLFGFEEMVEMVLDPVDDTVPMKCEYKEKRFILLYTLNQLASHNVGLLYDQTSHLCIICPDLDDFERVFWKRTKWYPLDVALEYWLNTIQTGDIVAVPEKHLQTHLDLVSSHYPWHYIRFHKQMLDETLEAFNKLVEAIEARLPQGSSLHNNNDDNNNYNAHGLVDADVLQLHNISAGFAREFLEKARTPRFKAIAPGLEVMTTSSMSKQPFIPETDEKLSKQSVPPFLLFYSKLNYDQSQDQIEPGGTGPFGYPYRNNTLFPAGLYLLQTMSDNTCKFILPFSIGGKGYACRTDGALYGENEPKDSFDDLYSLGFHPFETSYAQKLASILENWLGMVVSEAWKIDENGVAGGMEIWKDADSEEHWEKYVINRNFG
ncbi:hypothetical protein C7974DRAFT_211571 [Boeremia exigua]|uniref:uncharacterized protein n=1 Tax=Boeremia exigua TaxID=749465 RepID=UPI001E8C9DC6|nr:uncharacterized protein C7974DRAFT_211571 [Boeremia exigua]KAH6621816.1 hypothetical protein C7974DRAFT_211571 [Boeremia exigua]